MQVQPYNRETNVLYSIYSQITKMSNENPIHEDIEEMRHKNSSPTDKYKFHRRYPCGHVHFTVGTLRKFFMVRNIQNMSDCKVYGHIPIGDQSLFWKRIIIFKSSTKMRGLLFQIKRIEFFTQTIYSTKERDRFHCAATDLKPYKVGNICYMTYRYSVLYFLNIFFPKKTAIFVKISKLEYRYCSVY